MAAAQAAPREASVPPLKKELGWEVSKHRPAESVDGGDASVVIGVIGEMEEGDRCPTDPSGSSHVSFH